MAGVTKTMSAAQALVEGTARDLEVVGLCLPAHMMFLMMEQCSKSGLEMRPDVLQKLNMGAAAPLAQFDEFSVARLARKIDENAKVLLRDLSPDSLREGLYICAMFVMALVSESYLKRDRGNMAVLVALMLLDDVKDEKPDANGVKADWGLEEQRWKTGARKILSRAVLLGLYKPT